MSTETFEGLILKDEFCSGKASMNYESQVKTGGQWPVTDDRGQLIANMEQVASYSY
jgi:hypothetical protein